MHKNSTNIDNSYLYTNRMPKNGFLTLFKRALFSPVLLAAAFLFFSCDMETLFEPSVNDGVKAFFEEYTNTAAIEAFEFSKAPYSDSAGNRCIDSGEDCTVYFYLRNPQRYTLLSSLSFPELDASFDTSEVSVTQTAYDTIEVTYPKSFLYETDGGKSISVSVGLQEKMTLRNFNSYSLSLFANSVPPSISQPLFETSGENLTGEYIVCFYLPDISHSSFYIHRDDTHTLLIDGRKRYFDTTGKIYTTAAYTEDAGWTFSDEDPSFSNTRPTMYPISPVEQGGFEFPTEAPEGYNAVYYKTGITPSEDVVNITLTLQDDAGLTSSTVATNKAQRLASPTFNVESDNTYSVDESTGLFELVIQHSGLCTDGESCNGDALITYTVTDHTGESFTDSATGNASIQLPAGIYTVSAFASKASFITSDVVSESSITVKMLPIFYVSETGSDTENTGASLSPYRTIQKAIATFADRDAIGAYDANAVCDIRVLTDLTPPDTFDWSENTFINATVPQGKGYSICISSESGVKTINASRTTDSLARVLTVQAPVTLKNISITGGCYDNGGGVYVASPEGTLTLAGTILLTGSTKADGTTASNMYLPFGTTIDITASLAGSTIGVYMPFTDTEKPTSTNKIDFTTNYAAYNSELPATYFVSETDYAVAADDSGEASFAISGGGMYTAYDYEFTFELQTAAGSAATTFVPGTATTFTLVPTITQTEADGSETPLTYNADGSLTVTASGKAVSSETAAISAQLFCGTTKVTDLTETLTLADGVFTVTIPATVSLEDTYTLSVTITFLGFAHDAQFTLEGQNQ